MNKLNVKNKVFILIFSIIIFAIIVIMSFGVKLSGGGNKNDISVTSNTVLLGIDTNRIDTSSGGKIEKKWDGEYYYVSSTNNTYNLGKNNISYDLATGSLTILGPSYLVEENGSVSKSNSNIYLSNLSTPAFYKLEDRIYLIVADEIRDTEKTIFTRNYLLVYIDKQGNASVVNDSINIKTINPMNIEFGNYTFDVAQEKLIVGNSSIDLKSIIGSTNEYVFVEDKTIPKYDTEKLLDSYNKLVEDFTSYAKNVNYAITAVNRVASNTLVINSTKNSSGTSANNSTNINKKVSLRGSVSKASYIDVSYIVTDPEGKYHAVYLLVTGNINGTMTSEKIILDKYNTTYRVNHLSPNSEYTISLGYIEKFEENDVINLSDNIEDVINARTTKLDYTLKIEKIASGKVFFNYKMTENMAYESGKVVLYVDGDKKDSVDLDFNKMISLEGFSSSLNLTDGYLYELYLEDTVYDGRKVDDNIHKRFILSTVSND